MKILWLRDSKAGHTNKALGLLSALSQRVSIELVEHEIQWRWSGIRQILSRIGAFGFRFPLYWFLKKVPEVCDVDLIVSSGGATQWPNAALAQLYSVPNVYLGSLKKMNSNHFTIIIMFDPPHGESPYLKSRLIPSVISPKSAAAAAINEIGYSRKEWGLLIGGDGEGLHWNDNDYFDLVGQLFEQASKANVRVWVASSRRTPKHIEDRIREMLLGNSQLAGACWYHHRDNCSPTFLAMMGACSRLFVTADSTSMTHEAVSVGVGVVVVRPYVGSGNDRLKRNLNLLIDESYVMQVVLPLPNVEFLSPLSGWRFIAEDPAANLADEVLKRIAARHPSMLTSEPSAQSD